MPVKSEKNFNKENCKVLCWPCGCFCFNQFKVIFELFVEFLNVLPKWYIFLFVRISNYKYSLFSTCLPKHEHVLWSFFTAIQRIKAATFQCSPIFTSKNLTTNGFFTQWPNFLRVTLSYKKILYYHENHDIYHKSNYFLFV